MRPLAAAAAGATSLKHLQHPLGDDVTTNSVTGREQYADEADDLLQRRVRATQRHHRAYQHDTVYEVRSRHEGRVQDHRHPRDNLVAGESREHENIERNHSGHVCFTPWVSRPTPWRSARV